MIIEFYGIPFASGDWCVTEGLHVGEVTDHRHVIKDGKEADILEFTVKSVNNTDVKINKWLYGNGYSPTAIRLSRGFLMKLESDCDCNDENYIGKKCLVYVDKSGLYYRIIATKPLNTLKKGYDGC